MTEKLMFSLIRSKICGTAVREEYLEKLSQPGVLSQLFELSAYHDMAHIIGAALSDIEIEGELTEEDRAAFSKFENAVMKAVYRQSGIAFELDEICRVFEEAKIPFMPLKGAVLRKLYPEPWMRTSSDIDILVHKSDLKKAESVLVKQLKYVFKESGQFDISLYSEGGIHIELHFGLIGEGRANFAHKVLENVWDSATLVSGSGYQYEMSYSMFYFYHIAHMAKHFELGGAGIRPVIDLWLLDNKCEYDPVERDTLLEESKLLVFSNCIRELSRVWFEDGTSNRITEMLEGFIIPGGAYGTFENKVAVNQKKKGGKLGYVLSRLWLPYYTLKLYYPSLEKHKWLYPFFQVRRWFNLLFTGRYRRAFRELTANIELPKPRAATAEELFLALELF